MAKRKAEATVVSAKRPRKGKTPAVKEKKAQKSGLTGAREKPKECVGASKAKCKKQGVAADLSDSGSESEVDWEDVEEAEGVMVENIQVEEEEAKPQKDVEISIEMPHKKSKKQREQECLMKYLKKVTRKIKKETQENMHKTHLLLLLSNGFHRNTVCNDPLFMSVGLSLVPIEFFKLAVRFWDIPQLTKFVMWFKKNSSNVFEIKTGDTRVDSSLRSNKHSEAFVASARGVGFLVRLVLSFQTVPHKVKEEVKGSSNKVTPKKTSAKNKNTPCLMSKSRSIAQNYPTSSKHKLEGVKHAKSATSSVQDNEKPGPSGTLTHEKSKKKNVQIKSASTQNKPVDTSSSSLNKSVNRPANNKDTTTSSQSKPAKKLTTSKNKPANKSSSRQQIIDLAVSSKQKVVEWLENEDIKVVKSEVTSAKNVKNAKVKSSKNDKKDVKKENNVKERGKCESVEMNRDEKSIGSAAKNPENKLSLSKKLREKLDQSSAEKDNKKSLRKRKQQVNYAEEHDSNDDETNNDDVEITPSLKTHSKVRRRIENQVKKCKAEADDDVVDIKTKSKVRRRIENQVKKCKAEADDDDVVEITPSSKKNSKSRGNIENQAKKCRTEKNCKSDKNINAAESEINSKSKTQTGKKEKVEKLDTISIDSDFDTSMRFASPGRSSNSASRGNKSSVSILSSDDDSDDFSVPSTPGGSKDKKIGADSWAEVFLPYLDRWICVEFSSFSVNHPELCEKYATHPLLYVLAYDNENSVKDVTLRYASNWMTKTYKQRIDQEWWTESLQPYQNKNQEMEEKESALLEVHHLEKPLPLSVAEFKNHPLYVLKRHLLKYEAIYPESAAILGFCKGEPVYSRDCLHGLHTRESWIKEARVVKQGETAYKVVKGRPKRNQVVIDKASITVDLFGEWQTEPYKPPAAKDGKVPRNEYGNVEMFKACMLPPGTCHIQLPGVHKVARKLDIDCAPAVVGFDFHGGFTHPVMDGVVVCEEYKHVLIDAYEEEQEEIKKKQAEKKEKRVLGTWKLLVKGLLIKERLRRRFQTDDQPSTASGEEMFPDEIPTDISVCWPLNMQEGKTSSAGEGHCHVFLESDNKQDHVTGHWTKSCACGHTEPFNVPNENTDSSL